MAGKIFNLHHNTNEGARESKTQKDLDQRKKMNEIHIKIFR